MLTDAKGLRYKGLRGMAIGAGRAEGQRVIYIDIPP